MLLGSTSRMVVPSKVWVAPDYSIGFHHFDYECDQYDGLPHTHGEYCMVLCLNGCVQVLRGASVDLISPGELLVVNPGELHQCRFGIGSRRSEGFTLIVDRAVARSVFTEMSLPGSFSGAFPRITGKIQDGGIQSLAQQMIQECAGQQRGFGIVVDAL